MICHHCGSPEPVVRGLVCLPCASDAAYERMTFGTHRLLIQEVPQSGDEYRRDRAYNDWLPYDVLDFATTNQPGKWRRRVRLETEARRFLDDGELLRQGDERSASGEDWTTLPALPSVRVEPSLIRYRRALYVGFTPMACSCTKRADLTPTEGMKPAQICLDCGHVWMDYKDHDAVVTYKESRTACECDNVEKVAREPGLWPFQVKCIDCGAIWDQEEWTARKSPYPDLHTNDRETIRAIVHHILPRQQSFLDSYLLRAEQHRWYGLRPAAGQILGEEEAAKVDQSFKDVRALLDSRRGTDDGVAAAHSSALVDFVQARLAELRALLAPVQFDAEIREELMKAAVEQDAKLDAQLDAQAADLLGAVTGAPRDPLATTAFAPPLFFVNGAPLLPGQMIREGDCWLDGKLLRPVRVTIGKNIPQLPAEALLSNEAPNWECQFRRCATPNADADVEGEFRAYGGLGPALPSPEVTVDNLEKVLRQLYALSGIAIETFTHDRTKGTVTLRVRLPGATAPSIITVALP